MCMFCCSFWSNNCTQHSMTLACTLNKNNMFECVLKQQNAFRVWSRNLAKNVSSKHWEDTFFQKILEQLLFVTSIAPIWIGIQMTQLLQTMLFTSKIGQKWPENNHLATFTTVESKSTIQSVQVSLYLKPNWESLWLNFPIMFKERRRTLISTFFPFQFRSDDNGLDEFKWVGNIWCFNLKIAFQIRQFCVQHKRL